MSSRLAGEGDPAAAGVGFDAAIVHDFAEEFVEPEAFAAAGGGVAFGARDLNQAADEVGEPRDFLLHARDGGVAIVGGAGEFGGEAEARQRRAEFVGDVLQQAALGGEQRADALGHAVEGAADFADFILAGGVDAHGEIAGAEAIHHAGEAAQGRGEIGGEDPAEQRDGGENQEVVGQILAEIEEVFVDDDEAVLAVGGRVHHHLAALEAFRRAGVRARHGEQFGAIFAGGQVFAGGVGEVMTSRKSGGPRAACGRRARAGRRSARPQWLPPSAGR